VARLGTDDFGSSSPRLLHLIEAHPGQNSREGTALIGTSIKNPQTYAVGSLMLNGARLVEIYPDHVVLRLAGRTESLYLEQVQPTRHSDLLLVGGRPTQANETLPATSEAHSAQSITDYIRPNPVFDGDRLRGVELFPGAHADAFARLGLSAGDVITAVNGVAVTDAGDVMSLLEQLTQGGGFEATVKRGGQMVQVNLTGASLMTATVSSGSLPE
jgi:type II secretion system protein C